MIYLLLSEVICNANREITHWITQQSIAHKFCIMSIPDEEALKRLKWVSDLTVEDLHNLQRCNREGIYKWGLPFGITSAILCYYSIPMRLGRIKYILPSFVGCVSYAVGRFMYNGLCYSRVLRERSVKRTNEESEQDSPMEFSDKLLLEDDTFNSYQDMSHFNDIDSNFQEELPVEQPKNVKKSVTYEDLWKQHKDSQPPTKYLELGRSTTDTQAPQLRPSFPESSPFDKENI